MEYICRECGRTDTAETVEEIVNCGKLCTECLSEQNTKKKVRKIPSKKKKKSRKDYVHVCNECGAEYHSKPIFGCHNCNHMYFTYKKKGK